MHLLQAPLHGCPYGRLCEDDVKSSMLLRGIEWVVVKEDGGHRPLQALSMHRLCDGVPDSLSNVATASLNVLGPVLLRGLETESQWLEQPDIAAGRVVADPGIAFLWAEALYGLEAE